MKAMILAAGEGKRMRPLTDTMPKPLLPIQGKAIIEHHLDRLALAGFEQCVINVSYLGEDIVNYLDARVKPALNVQFSREAEPLETGGGIFNALPLLGSKPFVLVNGDVWTDYPFQGLALPKGMLAHMVLVENPPQHVGGDFAFAPASEQTASQANGSESRGQPRRGLLMTEGEEQYTYSGIAVLDPLLFAGCQPGYFPLPPLFRKAMQSGQVSGELYQGRWFDIGTPTRLDEINQLLAGAE
ncbi:MAG: mannose-1-phosphate guanylyltransferase [Gammaproteobacteria bacterium]|nr:MAG: mannose-1-phosphate guanylyltransferase [Gammaproteobacteria bacterium]